MSTTDWQIDRKSNLFLIYLSLQSKDHDSPDAIRHCWYESLVCWLGTWHFLFQDWGGERHGLPSAPGRNNHSIERKLEKICEEICSTYRASDTSIEHQQSALLCCSDLEGNTAMVRGLPGGQDLGNTNSRVSIQNYHTGKTQRYLKPKSCKG